MSEVSFNIFVAKLGRYELDRTAARVKADGTAGFKETVVPRWCVSGSKSKYQPAVRDVCWRLILGLILFYYFYEQPGQWHGIHAQQVHG